MFVLEMTVLCLVTSTQTRPTYTALAQIRPMQYKTRLHPCSALCLGPAATAAGVAACVHLRYYRTQVSFCFSAVCGILHGKR